MSEEDGTALTHRGEDDLKGVELDSGDVLGEQFRIQKLKDGTGYRAWAGDRAADGPTPAEAVRAVMTVHNDRFNHAIDETEFPLTMPDTDDTTWVRATNPVIKRTTPKLFQGRNAAVAAVFSACTLALYAPFLMLKLPYLGAALTVAIVGVLTWFVSKVPIIRVPEDSVPEE